MTKAEIVQTTSTLTIDALKNAGVDLKVTKNDVIDLITEQLQEEADRQVEEAAFAHKEAVDEFQEKEREYYQAFIDDVLKQKKVKKFKKDVETFLGAEVYLSMDDEGDQLEFSLENKLVVVKEEEIQVGQALEYCTRNYKSPPVKRPTYQATGNVSQVRESDFSEFPGHYHATKPVLALLSMYPTHEVKGYTSLGIYVPMPPAELSADLGDAMKTLTHALTLQTSVTGRSRKARLAVIRDILGNTDEGDALLTILDSRTAKAGLKKLSKGKK